MACYAPRFHVHPGLGAADVLVAALMLGAAGTPVERFNAFVGELVASAMQVGLLVTGLTIVVLKVIDSGRKIRAAVAGVRDNAAEISKLKAEAAAAKAAAAAAHAAAHRVAAEAEAKTAAAVAEARRTADAEVRRLGDELRQVRHMARDTAHEVRLDREVRARSLTPDPDRPGPLTVIVANDPSHPVPTTTSPPEPPRA